MKPKYSIIRHEGLGYEIIKYYFDETLSRWITETVGTTDSIGVAREFLLELESPD